MNLMIQTLLFLTRRKRFWWARYRLAITDSGTDLNGSITKTQTSLVVDGNDARELDKRMIQIDSELMVVSGSPSATILQVHRGVDGTESNSRKQRRYKSFR